MSCYELFIIFIFNVDGILFASVTIRLNHVQSSSVKPSVGFYVERRGCFIELHSESIKSQAFNQQKSIFLRSRLNTFTISSVALLPVESLCFHRVVLLLVLLCVPQPFLSTNMNGNVSFLFFGVVFFAQLLASVSSRGAGECAMLCNDLRFEVLTLEICR